MDIKDNCFLKISMYRFDVFKESKGNDDITTILTCLDTNPRIFCQKH